jgi:hypothetical protein
VLTAAERPRPGRSRIKGLRSVVTALTRIRQAMDLYCRYREGSEAEHAVAARIEARARESLIEIAALNLPPDPRRPVRKSSRTSR